MKYFLCVFVVLFLFLSEAKAQTAIWDATDRSGTATEMRFPVDTSGSSSPGHIKVTVDLADGIFLNSGGSLGMDSGLLFNSSTNDLTILGDFSVVDITASGNLGVVDITATGDVEADNYSTPDPLTKTASFTWALTDPYIIFDSAGSLTGTIPPNSSVAFPLMQPKCFEVFDGTNTATIAAGSGVTINTNSTLVYTSAAGCFMQVVTDQWTAVGGD